MLIFFFQAEDGIRDDLVTGVQTCALPILTSLTLPSTSGGMAILQSSDGTPLGATPGKSTLPLGDRSEERRVGKECRSRWGMYAYKEKRQNNSACSTRESTK